MTNKHQTNQSDTSNAIGIARLAGIKFNEGVSQAQREHILNELKALKNKIPAIKLLVVGATVPNPQLDKGFTHGIVIGFSNIDDLHAYEADPAFAEFGKLFAGSVLDNSWETDVPVAAGTQIHADAFPNVFRFLGFKFTRPAPQGQQGREEKILNKLSELPEQISDDIKLFLGGAPVAKNRFDKDFTQGFLVGFANIDDLRAYEANPAHQAFVSLLLAQPPMLDDSLVVDIQLAG